MGESADIPQGEPGDKPVPALPSTDVGTYLKSAGSMFSKVGGNVTQFFKDTFKFNMGLTVKGVLSGSTTVTKGWQHNTTVGYARAFVVGHENKFNAGVVFNYYVKGRHEEVGRNRKEVVIGAKFERFDGGKTLHETGQKVDLDEALKNRKTKIIEHHVAVLEQLLAKSIKEEVDQAVAEHQKLEALFKTRKAELDSAVVDVEKWNEKTEAVKSRIDDCKQQCRSVDNSTKESFKIIAKAAQEITVSGKAKFNTKGEVRWLGASLIKLAAAITKAG